MRGADPLGPPLERRVLRVVLRGEAGEVAQRLEALERLALELAYPLAREVQLVADRLERPGLALEPEAELQDAPLALRERVERASDALPAERLLGLVERVGGLAVGEEVSELTLVVRADGLVERDRRVGGSECLVDVLDRSPVASASSSFVASRPSSTS